jgi:hypothetical protein
MDTAQLIAAVASIAALVVPLLVLVRQAEAKAAKAIDIAHNLAQSNAKEQTRMRERIATLEQLTTVKIPSEMDLRIEPLDRRLGNCESLWGEWLPRLYDLPKKPEKQ